MSNRKIMRILLCLLMLWQLPVSATAHSMQMPDAMHQDHQRMQAMSMHTGCHHRLTHYVNHDQLDQCPCHGGVCKCSCAGLPALACVPVASTITIARHAVPALPVLSITASSLTALLRPPIA